MSNPSSSGSGKADTSKKSISPARNAIGLVVLLAVAAVGWFEYSAYFGHKAAVAALEARSQDEAKDLMTLQEAETLFGKAPDGPGSDIRENNRTFTKKTYTWNGLLKSYTLTAYYTEETTPHLHHYESEGAKFTPETPPPVLAAPTTPPSGPAPTPAGASKESKGATTPAPAPAEAPKESKAATTSAPAKKSN